MDEKIIRICGFTSAVHCKKLDKVKIPTSPKIAENGRNLTRLGDALLSSVCPCTKAPDPVYRLLNLGIFLRQ